MCDALSRNPSKEFETLLANCLSHGRRQFVDLANYFPAQCRHVLESLGEVYHYEAQAKAAGLSPEAGSGSTRSTARKSWTSSSTGWTSSWNRNGWNLTPGSAGHPLHAQALAGLDPVPAPGRRAPG